MATYIERIELNNYRSCKRTSVDLNRQLSTLIGVNGSGKTNILNGILLLNKVTHISRHLTSEEYIRSGCKVKVWFNVNKKRLRYEALITYATNERNVDEVLGTVEKWNFKEFTGDDTWLKFPLSMLADIREIQFSKSQALTETQLQFLLRHYDDIFKSPTSLDKIPFDKVSKLITEVHDFVTRISYYSASQFTDPSKCPTSIEIENDRIVRRALRTGGEHVKFMFDLYSTSKTQGKKFQEFLSVVGSEGIGLIDTIKYDEIDVPSNVIEVATGGRVISKEVKKLLVIPNFIIGGVKLSPNQLSEGTFKTLAIVFYLIMDKSSLVLLEEPEVCIHHGLLASIVEMVKTFSRRKQMIMSTHSDFVLDELDPSNVFMVKNDLQKGTIVKPVPKSMSRRDYEALRHYLNTSGNLGEYWRHGELEK